MVRVRVTVGVRVRVRVRVRVSGGAAKRHGAAAVRGKFDRALQEVCV
jgi:hypothetical protein